MGRFLKKEGHKDFLGRLKEHAELIAPVTRDLTRFEVIKDINDINLKGKNPFFPIKKYFLPNQENLLHIRKGLTKAVKEHSDKRIIFGARLCDINALSVLDKLFLNSDYPDQSYKQRRENTIIVGVNCITPPSEYCFCGSMDLKKESYDLLLHENENDYYIDVLTKKGEELVKYLPEEESDFPLPRTDKKLEEKNLELYFDNQYWENDSNLCVSCQRCTTLCPSCFCFDVHDSVNSATKNGERIRTIDSCHSKDFTQVAGGHVFRDTRLKRYRHRVLHKIQFFKEKFGRSMCTGCGRCIEYCHSKIDFVKTINENFT
ncbi:MAG: 4Fe-4S dicluster domain-containing protein [Nanoarchaeota archaeon]|nr:4Fe-4S dicluster domain-containing protein [Nanoarchaeota archaeon]MBU1270072.1 4Fe-4S dicluster domain-containing protein [Nanoarchaeota archaeon]MBU1604999.1 4Fe-4S dicluster domain-containing protein [Nanoarchaeota archaeon]MBU2443408.1 4Fe-4S dicluster domain-containing protein [Nanoarchaeota archaeon]